MDQRKVIQGEVIRTSHLERDEFVKRLKYVRETINQLNGMIFEMNGPRRVEIADAVVETRNGSGYEIPVTAGYYLMDIKSDIDWLQERLKG